MTSPQPTRPRVVVADDHPEVTKAICRLLMLDCDIVATVADGREAVRATRSLQPDVTVVDLNLPSLSGLEACRQITQENPQAKVVIFTAVNDPNVRRRSFEFGAAAFVCKVASDTDLLAVVRCLCDLP